MILVGFELGVPDVHLGFTKRPSPDIRATEKRQRK